MSRVPTLAPDSLTPEQKRVYDHIAGIMGGTVRGPFAALLSRPDILEPVFGLYRAYRENGKLERRLFELMVLIVAREWTAQYAWFVHEPHALDAGLPRSAVEAIKTRRPPEFARADEKMVYDITREMLDRRSLATASWDAGVAAFGLDVMVDLVTAIGAYQMIATVLAGFQVPTPDGRNPLL